MNYGCREKLCNVLDNPCGGMQPAKSRRSAAQHNQALKGAKKLAYSIK
jgi:hypothetical protein